MLCTLTLDALPLKMAGLASIEEKTRMACENPNIFGCPRLSRQA
jgi:hypothetical protein